uniref:Probable serine carboxypeptidase CPVL n=2 Tax=Vombatus ursinus TaxID=29139 RepID=A0A4X2LVF3_VOMUR
MWKATILWVLLTLEPSEGLFRSLYRNVRVCNPSHRDPGQPLFLTPYIKSGKIQEGKQLSLVGPFPGANVKSYSGYLTVNETYNSNLFFWFFPAQENPNDAPVVLWLQGGPGGSSMFGLFVEHGPYVVNKNLTVRARDFPWTAKFSMLYIDNPTGTGFSFTDDARGFAASEDDVARDLYSALTQFFQLFPEYRKNDFYATGESYAGKYVPAIAYYIHLLNPTAKVKINLKGVAIGDGFSDPETIIGGYPGFLYHIGLLDEKQKKYFQKQCAETIKYIKQEKWRKAFEIFDNLMNGDLTSYPSYFQNSTGCSYYFNFLQCQEPEEEKYFGDFLSLPEVRRAIHVGNLTFHDGSEVEKHMWADWFKSVKPWLAEIMNNYRISLGHMMMMMVMIANIYTALTVCQVLIYSGQLDIIVAAPLTERSLLVTNWKGLRDYKKVDKKIWRVHSSDVEVAGYVRQVGDFHQVIVRGGGHILPNDQPLRSFDMINRFIFGKGWEPY